MKNRDLKKFSSVLFQGGEGGRYPFESCDFMLAYSEIPDPDFPDEFIVAKLYAEAYPTDYGWTEETDDTWDESCDYEDLKEEILRQAQILGIDPDSLIFWYDDINPYHEGCEDLTKKYWRTFLESWNCVTAIDYDSQDFIVYPKVDLTE